MIAVCPSSMASNSLEKISIQESNSKKNMEEPLDNTKVLSKSTNDAVEQLEVFDMYTYVQV